MLGGKSFITSVNANKCFFPHTRALHYSIDPITSFCKSITVAQLMNAPNVAINRVDDPRPSHVLRNEANEQTEASRFSGKEGYDFIRGGRG